MNLISVLASLVVVTAAELVTVTTSVPTKPQSIETASSVYSDIIKIDKMGKVKLICFGERGLCHLRKLNQYDLSGDPSPIGNFKKWALQNIEVLKDPNEGNNKDYDQSLDNFDIVQ